MRRLRWLARLAETQLTRAVHNTLWQSLRAWGVLLWHEDIDASVVDLWRGRGRLVIAWTVNAEADKLRLLRLGVPIMCDSVIGDAPPAT